MAPRVTIPPASKSVVPLRHGNVATAAPTRECRTRLKGWSLARPLAGGPGAELLEPAEGRTLAFRRTSARSQRGDVRRWRSSHLVVGDVARTPSLLSAVTSSWPPFARRPESAHSRLPPARITAACVLAPGLPAQDQPDDDDPRSEKHHGIDEEEADDSEEVHVRLQLCAASARYRACRAVEQTTALAVLFST